MNFHAYRLKKAPAQMFSCEFYQIFQNTFFCKTRLMTASAKYPFLFVTSTSATKNISFKLGYFKYFREKHCELLANSPL